MGEETIDSTLGAALIGVIVAAILHGVSLGQTYYYFTHQFNYEDEGGSRDRWFGVKGLVTLVIFFDTVHQALISHSVYTYVVTDFGRVEELTKTVWSLLVEVLFNGFTAFLVQSFLTMRVWKLSGRNVYLTAVVYCLVLGEFVCVLVYSVIALTNPLTVEFLGRLKTLSLTVNVLAMAGDVLITISLVYLLQRSKTGFSRSKKMINRLIAFSLNTGMLTSLCAIASLVSIMRRPSAFIYIAFFFCIGRLYANSLLATLNARRSIRSSSAGGVVNSTSDSQWKDAGLSFSMASMTANPKDSQVGTTKSFGSLNSTARRPAHTAATHPSISGISIKIDTTKEYSCDPVMLRNQSLRSSNSRELMDEEKGNVMEIDMDKTLTESRESVNFREMTAGCT